MAEGLEPPGGKVSSEVNPSSIFAPSKSAQRNSVAPIGVRCWLQKVAGPASAPPDVLLPEELPDEELPETAPLEVEPPEEDSPGAPMAGVAVSLTQAATSEAVATRLTIRNTRETLALMRTKARRCRRTRDPGLALCKRVVLGAGRSSIALS
jgi:hypothetical protein